MKKTIIFLCLLSILIMGCSKDDDSSESSEIPANEKFFNEAKSLDGTTTLLRLKYNVNKDVERIEFEEFGLYLYSYEGDKIMSLDAFLQENKSFTFSYDNNGHIKGFSENGISFPVFYNEENKS